MSTLKAGELGAESRPVIASPTWPVNKNTTSTLLAGGKFFAKAVAYQRTRMLIAPPSSQQKRIVVLGTEDRVKVATALCSWLHKGPRSPT